MSKPESRGPRRAPLFKSQLNAFFFLALPGIEWVILGDHRAGSMQVRTLRRRYSSLRNP